MTEPLASPIADRHAAAGAKLAPFAGWSMPLSYAGTLVEHRAVRDRAGIFDVSHLGTVWIEGGDAEAVLAATFTNDPARLGDGGSQYTLCCDEAGGIVDDLIVYRLAADRWVAIPNAANTAEVVRALHEAARSVGDVEVRDASTDWAILAIQGPASLHLADDVLRGLDATRVLSDLDHLEVAEVVLAGEPALLCRTGYTGEPGGELVLPSEPAARVWDRAVDAGAEPCGLGARDTLRLEMGYPLHGNELDPSTSPYEARLGWAVKLDRGAFRGRDALRAVKEAGPPRRSWGLRSDGRRPLRAGLPVQVDGASVGTTTSGGFSPTLERGIALALLDRGIEPGAQVDVDVRGSAVPCEVVRPPFVERDPRGVT